MNEIRYICPECNNSIVTEIPTEYVRCGCGELMKAKHEKAKKQ